MHPSRGSKGRNLIVLASAAFLAGCAGSNLFGLAAAVGSQGPSIEITAPTEGLTVDEGASITVTATAEAPDGINSVKVSGVFKDDGTPAYVEDTQTFQAVPVVNVNKVVGAVGGAGTGEAWVIVTVTDGVGTVKADSVTVVIS